jgi:hypothetical protein
MLTFPLVAAVLALACCVAVARDYLAHPKPDKVTWSVAFAMFAIAAGAEVVGSVAGWSAWLARVYYVLGPTLVVGYLALGELYLLMRRSWADRVAGVLVGLTALAVALVWRAPIEGDLKQDGWQALERGPGLVAVAVGINALGTLILLGGLLYSAWRFKRHGVMRNRMLGCLLIAGGTLAVASGGTLTRLGSQQYLYIAMALGTALIFVGYLRARQPDVHPATKIAADLATPANLPSARLLVGAASQQLRVSFVRASAGGHIVLPPDLTGRITAREGDLIAMIETDDGLLITTRETFTTSVLDRIQDSLSNAEPESTITTGTAAEPNGHGAVMSERPVEHGVREADHNATHARV